MEWRTELDEATRERMREAAREGHILVLWSPEECQAQKDLLERLKAVEERMS
jgi:hypothetical protein